MPDVTPPLPEAHVRKLAQKLVDGHLALFVGAGISHLARRKDGTEGRLPLWGELRRQIANNCLGEEADEFSNPLELFDAVVVEHDRGTLETEVRRLIDDRPYEPSSAHQDLAQIPWRDVFTTNYDGLLERSLAKSPVVSERDYDRIRDEARPRLFQIHGTLKNPHTLTRDDYRLWDRKHPRAIHELKDVFLNGSVLFVGYGMNDPHLDTLLEKVREMTRGYERRFYAWTWQTSQRKRQMLDRNDRIESVNLLEETDWAAAFRQLLEAYKELRLSLIHI